MLFAHGLRDLKIFTIEHLGGHMHELTAFLPKMYRLDKVGTTIDRFRGTLSIFQKKKTKLT